MLYIRLVVSLNKGAGLGDHSPNPFYDNVSQVYCTVAHNIFRNKLQLRIIVPISNAIHNNSQVTMSYHYLVR